MVAESKGDSTGGLSESSRNLGGPESPWVAQSQRSSSVSMGWAAGEGAAFGRHIIAEPAGALGAATSLEVEFGNWALWQLPLHPFLMVRDRSWEDATACHRDAALGGKSR